MSIRIPVPNVRIVRDALVRTTRITACAVLAVLAALTALSLLNHAGLVPPTSPLFGADYVPPLWLLIAALFPLTVLALLGWRGRALCGMVTFSSFAVFFGDLSFSRRIPASATHAAAEFSVLA